jgi:hypothetical protein
MQKIRPKLGGFVLGLWVLVGMLTSAEAVIKIETAEEQDGVAFIKGKGAANGAQITWEGGVVTTANTKNGGFSFLGVLPADCQGTLSDGSETVQVNVLGCTPAPDRAPVAVTGQTGSLAPGDDGDIQAGVPFPSPRFTDNGDGTVTDNLTGLIWLKNANCFDEQTWANALSAANNLASGSCGLTDGSVAGDWLLSNVRELQSLIHFGTVPQPALPVGHPFLGGPWTWYWSSTSGFGRPNLAWAVDLGFGRTDGFGKNDVFFLVWPVRGGQ